MVKRQEAEDRTWKDVNCTSGDKEKGKGFEDQDRKCRLHSQDSIKYLGVHFDADMAMGTHIKKMPERATKV